MNFALFLLRRRCSRYAGLAGIITVLLLCFGCGSSSTSSDSSNGNSGTAAGGNSTGNSTGLVGGTTGSVGGGFPETPAGDPLANTSLPVGTWGGVENVDGELHPGSLQVSSSGGQFALYCGRSAQYAGAGMLDAAGRFKVQGTGHLRLNSLAPADSGTVLFSGQVGVSTASGKSVTSMVLTVSDPISNVSYGNYTLILGNNAPAYTGTCPGP